MPPGPRTRCTVEDVREALGHADLETTVRTYVHFFDPEAASKRRLDAKIAAFGA